MTQYAPFARIILRYLAGIAGATGWAADQDLVMALSLIIGAAVEAFYLYAKRSGGTT